MADDKDKARKENREQNKYKMMLDAAIAKAKDDPSPENLAEVQRLSNASPQAAVLAAQRLSTEQAALNDPKNIALLKTLLSVGGVMASLSQIAKSNIARRGLIPPGIPGAPGVDQGLNQQIFNAQLGSMNAGRAKAAADVGINDAYNQAVQSATNTAAGQSGMRQALINKANLNKMRANAELIPGLDAIRAREEARADQLIGHRADLAQSQYGQQLQATGMALDQYNKNSAAIGALGAIGHENLFSQLQGMPENLVGGLHRFANPYAPVYPDRSAGDTPEVTDNAIAYGNHLIQNLKGHATGYVNRAGQQPFQQPVNYTID